MNAKIKSEIGAVVVSMLLVVGVLTFSLSSQLQSADAEKEKDKYDKLRESIRKKAEVTAGISDRGDRGDVDIFSSNKNTTSEAIRIAGADGVNGTDGADGISGKNKKSTPSQTISNCDFRFTGPIPSRTKHSH